MFKMFNCYQNGVLVASLDQAAAIRYAGSYAGITIEAQSDTMEDGPHPDDLGGACDCDRCF